MHGIEQISLNGFPRTDDKTFHVNSDCQIAHTRCTVLVTTGGTNRTITLPPPVASARLFVKKVDNGSGVVILSPASGNVEFGDALYLNLQGNYAELISDGTDFFLRGGGV